MTQSQVFTFAVVDDHTMVRRGIIDTLLDEPDFMLVGQGGTAEEALQLALSKRPALMMLDVNMPGGGLDAVARIRLENLETRLVMFSFRRDIDIVRASIAAGATGYIVKGAPARELVAGIRTVLSGQTYIDPQLVDLVEQPAPRSRHQL